MLYFLATVLAQDHFLADLHQVGLVFFSTDKVKDGQPVYLRTETYLGYSSNALERFFQ
jgi:hypothetical protein